MGPGQESKISGLGALTPPTAAEREAWPFQVSLGDSLFALVDRADIDFLNQWDWSWGKSSNGGRIYARRGRKIGGKNHAILMHRFLMFAPDKFVVDHINGDTLDNRKGNLRVCTQAQNSTHRQIKLPKSGYRGVKANNGRYSVEIIAHGTYHYGGVFDDPIIAARRYDALAVKFKGEYAVLNFPNEAR